MRWRDIDLHGAGAIERQCGLYEVVEPRVPGGRFKVQVIEERGGRFVALLNVCLRASDGAPDGMAGLGRSEAEALEDGLASFMAALDERPGAGPEAFAWSDPLDFG